MKFFSVTQSFSLVSKIFDTKRATEPFIQMQSFKPTFSFGRHSTRLARAWPEEVGIPSEHIAEFLKKLSTDKTLNMHDVLVIRGNKLICEASFGAQRTDIWKHTFSACKSITSLAIGLLIDDGLLSLSDRILPLFPNEAGAIAKLKLKDLTVEDLLTMQSSVLFSEVDSAVHSEWKEQFLNSPTSGEIGKTFRYNSLNTYMLSAIVCKKTGKSLSDFLDERLFEPLGIIDYYWEKSPEDIEKGGWGLYIFPEDIAKIVMLVMDGGVWEGRRIISEDYLKLATSLQVKVEDNSCHFDYGYQIWVGNDADCFLFNGMLGQNMLGFRKNGVILISHAGNGEFFQTGNYFKYVKEYFNRDFDDSLPINRKQARRLSRVVANLSSYKKTNFIKRLFYHYSKRDVPTFSHFIGDYNIIKGDTATVGVMPLVLQVIQGEYTKGLVKIRLHMENGKPCLSYIENGGCYTFPLGFEQPHYDNYTFGKHNFVVGNAASLKKNEEDQWVLSLRLDFMETPCSRMIKMIFCGDEILVRHTELPGEEFLAEMAGDIVKEMTEKPIMATFFEKIGDDYIAWKLKKSFSPELWLQKEIKS